MKSEQPDTRDVGMMRKWPCAVNSTVSKLYAAIVATEARPDRTPSFHFWEMSIDMLHTVGAILQYSRQEVLQVIQYSSILFQCFEGRKAKSTQTKRTDHRYSTSTVGLLNPSDNKCQVVFNQSDLSLNGRRETGCLCPPTGIAKGKGSSRKNN